MNNEWPDYLSFSKGERRSLLLLLILIAAGSALLVISDKDEGNIATATQPGYIVNPANAPTPIPIDTNRKIKAPMQPSAKTIHRRSTASTPRASFPRTEKFPAGTVVELNTADTVTLKKVPGIGSVFASRIVKYRTSLGGFYSVEQLRDVYGMDEERYLSLQSWFHVDTSFIAKLPVNHLPTDSLKKHPYISPRQARVIQQICRKKGRVEDWEGLRLLEEFTESDLARLSPYLSFQ
ncbi:MAG: helix-hairpin-helix domain-containing protein [Tannerellaceae bacterium]|jgi:competence ComEA-like helix-hairpin-helix protein|nr:helix-hairpin-helix domain-containing protein [Tannerellaceae bacterium]